MKDFTVKDIAKILGVSKPTIQRAINAAAIEASREDKQTRYYSLDAAAAISEKVKPGFDFLACVGSSETPPHDAAQAETPPQPAETDRKIDENEAAQAETEPKQAETPPQEESLAFMRDMLKTIQEQLAAKDKQIAAYEAQIAVQNEQIRDYSDRLKEAMELTRGQQYIAAADKTAELMAAGNKEDTESQEEEVIIIAEEEPATSAPVKKTLWERIWKKNKGE